MSFTASNTFFLGGGISGQMRDGPTGVGRRRLDGAPARNTFKLLRRASSGTSDLNCFQRPRWPFRVARTWSVNWSKHAEFFFVSAMRRVTLGIIRIGMPSLFVTVSRTICSISPFHRRDVVLVPAAVRPRKSRAEEVVGQHLQHHRFDFRLEANTDVILTAALRILAATNPNAGQPCSETSWQIPETSRG